MRDQQLVRALAHRCPREPKAMARPGARVDPRHACRRGVRCLAVDCHRGGSRSHRHVVENELPLGGGAGGNHVPLIDAVKRQRPRRLSPREAAQCWQPVGRVHQLVRDRTRGHGRRRGVRTTDKANSFDAALPVQHLGAPQWIVGPWADPSVIGSEDQHSVFPQSGVLVRLNDCIDGTVEHDHHPRVDPPSVVHNLREGAVDVNQVGRRDVVRVVHRLERQVLKERARPAVLLRNAHRFVREEDGRVVAGVRRAEACRQHIGSVAAAVAGLVVVPLPPGEVAHERVEAPEVRKVPLVARAKVPLPDGVGGIASGLEQLGHKRLAARHPKRPVDPDDIGADPGVRGIPPRHDG
mmetsp:Transcript_24904/g.74986  ORF Transcript_24904/g.74986 Transcript_24904/m.74986 type:complete len:352 (-) Transcript_24904:324-1379(-)